MGWPCSSPERRRSRKGFETGGENDLKGGCLHPRPDSFRPSRFPSHRIQMMKSKSLLLLLLLLCGLLYLTRLGTVTFYEEDEPRFASAVRTMVETGDYITPRFNGKLRINKPILFYWLASATSHVVGVGELGARLPSALLATALVLMAFFFARAYGSLRFAGLVAFLVATCLQYAVVLGRAATADMTFIFFLTGALFAFFRSEMEPGSRRWMLWFWASLALATLAKGPAAVVLASATVGLFLILRGNLLDGMKRTITIPGLALFALIAVPWFAVELHLLGKTFWRGFFIAEHFGRYAGTADPHHGPIWFFIPVLLLMFYPWSLFLPAGLAGVWAERRSETAPLRLYALCWSVVVFGLFTFSGTKLPHYIAPLYPAAAILAAHAWEERLAGQASRLWQIGASVLALLGLLLGGALLFVGLDAAMLERLSSGLVTESEPRLVVFGLLLGGAGLLGGALLLARRRPETALCVMGGLLVAAIAWGNIALAPVVARCWQDPLRHLAEDAAARAGERGQLAIYATASSGVVYYSKRTVAWVKRHEDTHRLEALARRGPLYVITKPSRMERIPAHLGLRELRREGAYILLGPAKGIGP